MLICLDGWGLTPHGKGNAVSLCCLCLFVFVCLCCLCLFVCVVCVCVVCLFVLFVLFVCVCLCCLFGFIEDTLPVQCLLTRNHSIMN